jgi:hypothetical protein
MTRRAAHFIAIPEVFGNPQNDALMRAFLELGYCIDIYSPPPLPDPVLHRGIWKALAAKKLSVAALVELRFSFR